MRQPTTNNRIQGNRGEEAAVEYLAKHRYLIRKRNYRFGRGEIDIIAEDGPVLVFVEVKARRSTGFGPPEEAVTPAKRRQIRRIAEGYLFEEKIEDRACRFDVVAVEFDKNGTIVRHIEDAF